MLKGDNYSVMNKKIEKLILSLWFLVATVILNTSYVYAQITFEGVMSSLTRVFLPVAVGAIGIPLILVNGYKLMTSQGDPQQTRDAKEGLTAAILGLLFLLFSMTLLRIILSSFFGV